ncbi:MAG TPA: deoxyhypusine synthase family protein [Terriglobia bacterium]|nr:deoxyhypusine synthase family protein [Terriglobia bacterium]
MSNETLLEPLERLDLRKNRSVGEIVAAMSRSSFGARMLGEVAFKLRRWIEEGQTIRVVYDGSELRDVFVRMQSAGWIRDVSRAEDIGRTAAPGEKYLVVGRYSEAADRTIHQLADAVFINKEELSRPGQIRDGYFPDAVFADPTYVLPVLRCALDEWLNHKRSSVENLFDEIGAWPFGRSVISGAARLVDMTSDPECVTFLTLSGAMTIAKMAFVICDMIDLGMVHGISSTGALMAHGLIEGVGLRHYKHNPAHSDLFLAEHKLNRVTDTLEPEENFTHIEHIVDEVLWTFDSTNPISPSQFHAAIGKYLAERFPGERGILKSAYLRKVPVLCPAFVDSEIGNDLYVHNERRRRQGLQPLIVWPELDSALLIRMMTETPRAGIFSVGGGVPRNNTQNVAPLIEIANERLGSDLPPRMFSYGCRIAPDAMHTGHLSGCTYSENGSWRKMDIEHGRFAEIRADATQVWPFIVRYAMDRKETATE